MEDWHEAFSIMWSLYRSLDYPQVSYEELRSNPAIGMGAGILFEAASKLMDDRMNDGYYVDFVRINKNEPYSMGNVRAFHIWKGSSGRCEYFFSTYESPHE